MIIKNYKFLAYVLRIFIVISLISFAKFYKIVSNDLTHTTRNSFYTPTVLRLKNELIYVSYPKKNSNVMIKLESSNDTCNIDISVPDDSDVLSPEAQILGNGDIVIGLIVSAELDDKMYLRFFIVDLKTRCKYKDFQVPIDDEMLQNFKPFTIIPYEKTFDVFSANRIYCRPPGSFCLVR